MPEVDFVGTIGKVHDGVALAHVVLTVGDCAIDKLVIACATKEHVGPKITAQPVVALHAHRIGPWRRVYCQEGEGLDRGCTQPLGSAEVGWFDTKLRRRAQPFGILIAANGITGNAADRTAAHDVISAALAEGRQFVVITRDEIENLTLSIHLVELIQNKLCELAVAGTLLM